MKYLLLIILLFCCCSAYAQNLVPNPSFEEYSSCPGATDEINRASGWSSFGGSPDYFNICASGTSVDVPLNEWGYQEPKQGEAYGLLATYVAQAPNTREFIGANLLQQLVIGTRYFVSAYISRADSQPANGGSDNFGFKFSTVAYSGFHPAPIDNFSQVHCDSIVKDEINWILISGSFIADSNYAYIIMGNFYDDAHTDTFNINNDGAGYYVDCVCVTTDSLYNLNWLGIKNLPDNKVIQLYPNPVNNIIHVKGISTNDSFSLLNLLGEVYLSGLLNETGINVSTMPDGIYFIIINNFYFDKIIIQH